MKLYTKGGDKGRTSLIGGERVSKTDIRVNAYGTVDELGSFVALLGDTIYEKHSIEDFREDFQKIGSILMSIESILAVGKGAEGKIPPISNEQVEWIEGRIDSISDTLKPITSFTIPGGCSTVSLCHVCRTVCRRAERCSIEAAEVHDIDANSLKFINRLSDYLYALGRYLTERLGIEETLWRP